MIKNYSALEVEVGDRVYRLICASNSPLGELHDVLVQMKSFVIARINEAQDKEVAKEEGES